MIPVLSLNQLPSPGALQPAGPATQSFEMLLAGSVASAEVEYEGKPAVSSTQQLELLSNISAASVPIQSERQSPIAATLAFGPLQAESAVPAPIELIPQPAVLAISSFKGLTANSVPAAKVANKLPVVELETANPPSGTNEEELILPDSLTNASDVGTSQEAANSRAISVETGIVESSSSIVGSPIKLPELPAADPTPAASEIVPSIPQILQQNLIASYPQILGNRFKNGEPTGLISVKISTGSSVRSDKWDTDIVPVGKSGLATNNFVPSAFAIPVPAAEASVLNSLPFATPNAVSATITPQLDLARDLAWIGNLAQEIVAASASTERLSFRLMPQSLGRLDIEMVQSPAGLQVEMTATTDRAAQIIASEQPRLIEELRQSGVRMAPADQTMGQQSGSQRQQQQRQDLPFTATKTQATETPNRPDGRFA